MQPRLALDEGCRDVHLRGAASAKAKVWFTTELNLDMVLLFRGQRRAMTPRMDDTEHPSETEQCEGVEDECGSLRREDDVTSRSNPPSRRASFRSSMSMPLGWDIGDIFEDLQGE